MGFSGDTFELEMLAGRYVYGGQASNMPKIHDARLAAEFTGIATGLSTLAARATAIEGELVTVAPGGLSNFSITESHSSDAMTFALKTAAGSDASATDAVQAVFQDFDGSLTEASITGALSLTINSTATLGHASANPSPIYQYLILQAGAAEYAVSTKYFGPFGTVTTTTMGTGADSSTVMYSATGRTSVPFILIGRAMSTQTTAGTWAASPTELVCAPFRLKTYAFSAKRASGQASWLNATTTKVNVNSELFDLDSAYDHATNFRFTCQEPGVHEFFMQAGTDGDITGFVLIVLYKNGSEVTRGPSIYQAGGEKATGFLHYLIDLVPGDYIEEYAHQQSGGTRTIFSASNQFWGAIRPR